MTLQEWCDNNRQDLLNEWDYNKNTITPNDVASGSSKKVWWKCKKGHTWNTRISVRTKQKSICPICNRGLKSSFPEQAIYYYLSKYFNSVRNGIHDVIDMELDNYIDDLKIAIEYDGYKWHSNEENITRDKRKNELCKKHNIILIRVREKGLPQLDDCIQVYRTDIKTNDSLNKCIFDVLNIISPKQYDIDVKRDYDLIYQLYSHNCADKSLEFLYPDLLKDWDYDRNIVLPSEINAHSHFIAHWKCKSCGYSWDADVHNRTGKKEAGCPKCAKIRRDNKQKSAVINISTNTIYDSLGAAAQATGISKSSILKCIKGETQTSGGYKWKYLNDKAQQRIVKFKKSKRVLNIDTGEIYDSLSDATFKTKINNIGAVCSGRREKAGGYRWRYLTDDE